MESGRAVAGCIVPVRALHATPGRGADRRGNCPAGATISPSFSLSPVDVPPQSDLSEALKPLILLAFLGKVLQPYHYSYASCAMSHHLQMTDVPQGRHDTARQYGGDTV